MQVKQHAVLEALLSKLGSEGSELLEGITSDVSESLLEINYFRKISWLPSDASPAMVVARVEEELLGNLKYILYDECSEMYVEGPNGIRDKGRGKVHFADFMQHPNVKDAELTPSHVAALRLYT